MSEQGTTPFYTARCSAAELSAFSIKVCGIVSTVSGLEPGYLWMHKVRSPGLRIVLFVRENVPRLLRCDSIVDVVGQQIRYLRATTPSGESIGRSKSFRGLPFSKIDGAIWMSQHWSILVARRIGACNIDNPDFALCCCPASARLERNGARHEMRISNYWDSFPVEWEMPSVLPSWIHPEWLDPEFLRNIT